jgi:hypothetical protein
MDPIYFAVGIINNKSEGIFYAPHGFELSDDQLQQLEGCDIKLLITTFSHFKLPGLLGGVVNPGLNNVKILINQLNPKNVINTHDERKIMKGLVGKYAKVVYPDFPKLIEQENLRFCSIQDYNPVTF